MKLIILTITILLSILAGSLSVTIVDWATTPPVTAHSQILSSPACDSTLTQLGYATDERRTTSATEINQAFGASSASAGIRSSTPSGCTIISAAPADFRALADLQAGR